MEIRKVVYSACFGGFGLSDEAKMLAYEITGNKRWVDDYGFLYEIERHDETLVQVVEELGESANGAYANLKIEEVSGPYRIDEYDGYESVETPDSYDWV